MTAAPLSDAAAREAIRTHLDTTVFVDAGAGTGKTTALVGRVVELVRGGEAIPAIAAITFTEAAAAELRERVREALDAEEAAGTVPAGTVNDLDDAAITTLHGFAQRLLAAAPLDAGLPPRFEVLDGTDAQFAFDQRWSRFCDEVEAHPDAAMLIERALASGVGYGDLKGAARNLNLARHRLPPGPATLPTLAPVDITQPVTALRAAAACCAFACDPDDKLYVQLSGSPGRPGFAELAAELEGATSDIERIDALAAIKATRANPLGRKQSWPDAGEPGNIEEVRALRSEAFEAVDTTLLRAGDALASALTALLTSFVESYAAERLQLGAVEFHDLLIAARDLLRSDQRARQQLAQRYHRLLVDEFQDTDPLQIELVTLLATSVADPRTTPWNELALQPGRAFFVGDAKQSIYRFRDADLTLFDATRVAHGGETLVLDSNFRSVPGILGWVNTVFERLLDTSGTGTQAAPQPLSAARASIPGSPPPVRVLGSAVPAASMADLRDADATEIAEVLADAHRSGWPVDAGTSSDGSPTQRAARWEDMAVLLPTRRSLPHLEAALTAAGVPYRVDSASLVWSSTPVREVLLVLRALADPNDVIALAGALRSPLLGCSDEHLLEYHRVRGSWQEWVWRRPPDGLPAEHPVCVALAALQELHRDAESTPVGALVDRVTRRLGAYELATAQRRPRDHWRRLRFVVDQARAFTHDQGGSLASFVQWALLQGSDEVHVREPVLPEDDDDAVRVLTIHGAKGREFPICVLSGLSTVPRTSTPDVLWTAEGEPAVRYGSLVENDAHEQLKEREKAFSDEERIRLLYVAATRARDHLVVCVHRTESDAHNAITAPHKASLAALVASAMDAGDQPPAAEEVEEPAPTEPAPTGAAGSPAGEPPASPDLDAVTRTWLDDERSWRRDRLRLLTTDVRQPVLAVTTLATRLHQGLPVFEVDAGSDAIGASQLLDGTVLLTDDPAPTAGDLAPLTDEPATTGHVATDEAPQGATGGESEGEADQDAGLPISPEPAADAPAGRRGRAGTAIGRAVHATLQLADLADLASVAPIAAAQATAEGIVERAREVTELATAALGTDVVRAAVTTRHWRELYLAAPMGDILLEGFVDLLYETAEGLVVVDYKTDAVRDEATIDAAVARYRPQLAAYSLLVGATTGRPVAAAALVFLRRGQAETRWITDLADATAEVRSALLEAPG